MTAVRLQRGKVRQLLWCCLVALACSSDLEPSSPRVLVRQQVATGPEPLTKAIVQGDVVVVQGRFRLLQGCRTLRGAIEEKAGPLLLNVIATWSRQPCSRSSQQYDYEVRIGPLAPGSFQLIVVERTAERLQWPAPIALRTELRVD